MYQTLTPALGRDYKSKKAVLADWDANKDFRMEPQGCYVNKQQVDQMKSNGIKVLNIRYNQNRKVTVVKL